MGEATSDDKRGLERNPDSMILFRLGCARFLAALLAGPLFAQAPAAPPKPQPPKNNPFETIPQAPQTESPKPAPPGASPSKPAAGAEPAPAFEDVIEAIEFRGVRRVPQDTLRAMIFTKKGDSYNEDSIHRDFMALWNTGRF